MEQRSTLLAAKTAGTLENVTRVVAGGTFFLGLTIDQWQSVFGILAAVTGILATVTVAIVTCYYKRKSYKLAEARARHDGVVVDPEEFKDYDDD